jgi:hypothetical protein
MSLRLLSERISSIIEKHGVRQDKGHLVGCLRAMRATVFSHRAGCRCTVRARCVARCSRLAKMIVSDSRDARKARRLRTRGPHDQRVNFERRRGAGRSRASTPPPALPAAPVGLSGV